MPKSRWLAYFSARFPTVEVNNTVITVKANRFITHIKRMKDCSEPLETFWERTRRMGDKIGAVLFQLPPRFKADHDRLISFCELLPKEMTAAFEFRDPSWETPGTYEILDRVGAAFVLADWPHRPASDVLTGGWSYVRLHKGNALRMGYSGTKLRRWADRIVEMEAERVYVYFNNDPGGAALRDARTLTTLLAERGANVCGPAHQADRRAG